MSTIPKLPSFSLDPSSERHHRGRSLGDSLGVSSMLGSSLESSGLSPSKLSKLSSVGSSKLSSVASSAVGTTRSTKTSRVTKKFEATAPRQVGHTPYIAPNPNKDYTMDPFAYCGEYGKENYKEYQRRYKLKTEDRLFDRKDPFDVEFQRRDVKDAIHVITSVLKTKGLATPYLLLPFRPGQNYQGLKEYLSLIFDEDGMPLSALAIQKISEQQDAETLVSALKFFWCRMPGDAVIGWRTYTKFVKMEEQSNYPPRAFLEFMPSCLNSGAHASIVYDFFDLIVALVMKSKKNGLSARKLTRVCGLWAFHPLRTVRSGVPSFERGLYEWVPAGDAVFHLFLAFLKAMPPKGDVSKLPKHLGRVLKNNDYPPMPSTASVTSSTRFMQEIPMITMRVNHPSRNPAELLSRVSKTLRFDDPTLFYTREDFLLLKRLFRDPQTIVDKLSPEAVRILDNMCLYDEDLLCHGNTPENPVKFRLVAGWAVEMTAMKEVEEENEKEKKERKAAGKGGKKGTKKKKKPLKRATTPDFFSADVSRACIDDYFIWTWLSSLGPEETSAKKKTFGKTYIMEVQFAEGFKKWIIIEEQDFERNKYDLELEIKAQQLQELERKIENAQRRAELTAMKRSPNVGDLHDITNYVRKETTTTTTHRHGTRSEQIGHSGHSGRSGHSDRLQVGSSRRPVSSSATTRLATESESRLMRKSFPPPLPSKDYVVEDEPGPPPKDYSVRMIVHRHTSDGKRTRSWGTGTTGGTLQRKLSDRPPTSVRFVKDAGGNRIHVTRADAIVSGPPAPPRDTYIDGTSVTYKTPLTGSEPKPVKHVRLMDAAVSASNAYIPGVSSPSDVQPGGQEVESRQEVEEVETRQDVESRQVVESGSSHLVPNLPENVPPPIQPPPPTRPLSAVNIGMRLNRPISELSGAGGGVRPSRPASQPPMSRPGSSPTPGQRLNQPRRRPPMGQPQMPQMGQPMPQMPMGQPMPMQAPMGQMPMQPQMPQYPPQRGPMMQSPSPPSGVPPTGVQGPPGVQGGDMYHTPHNQGVGIPHLPPPSQQQGGFSPESFHYNWGDKYGSELKTGQGEESMAETVRRVSQKIADKVGSQLESAVDKGAPKMPVPPVTPLRAQRKSKSPEPRESPSSRRTTKLLDDIDDLQNQLKDLLESDSDDEEESGSVLRSPENAAAETVKNTVVTETHTETVSHDAALPQLPPQRQGPSQGLGVQPPPPVAPYANPPQMSNPSVGSFGSGGRANSLPSVSPPNRTAGARGSSAPTGRPPTGPTMGPGGPPMGPPGPNMPPNMTQGGLPMGPPMPGYGYPPMNYMPMGPGMPMAPGMAPGMPGMMPQMPYGYPYPTTPPATGFYPGAPIPQPGFFPPNMRGPGGPGAPRGPPSISSGNTTNTGTSSSSQDIINRFPAGKGFNRLHGAKTTNKQRARTALMNGNFGI